MNHNRYRSSIGNPADKFEAVTDSSTLATRGGGGAELVKPALLGQASKTSVEWNKNMRPFYKDEGEILATSVHHMRQSYVDKRERNSFAFSNEVSD